MSNLASIFGSAFVANQDQAAVDARGGQPLPAGTYITMIDNASVKPTKAGTGQFVEVVLEVVDGPCTGRKVWARLNILNPNPTAQEIGRKDFNMLVCSTGLKSISSTDELMGKYTAVRVVIDKEGRNEVKSFMLPSAVNTPPAALQAPVVHPTTPAFPQPAAPAQMMPSQFLATQPSLQPAYMPPVPLAPQFRPAGAQPWAAR